MDLRKCFKPLGYLSAFLGIVQRITWTLLSILTLFIHFEVWTVNLTLKTHKDLLSSAILAGYILRDEGFSAIGNVFIKPKHFYIWVIVFLIISIFWILLSVYFFIVLIKNETHNFKKTMLAWCIWTFVICTIDLLLTGLLANDYSVLVAAYNTQMSMDKLYALLSCAVLMAISAKGFVMWFVNIILTIFLLRIYSKLPKNFKTLKSQYSTNSLAYLKYPNAEDGRIKSKTTEHSLESFQGLPRVGPVQSINRQVNLPTNLKDVESYNSHHPKHIESLEYYAKPTLRRNYN
ncbi:hypothetical protein RN001_009974 [Aquatica leii]|uniref:Uncharacterized protein n=1 Tax=Aquatica leii TaxID=1421715 RepID=A0AAN7SN32_9COLE|nr:hypothetical protein RN001_009974 [Aquatica leii]